MSFDWSAHYDAIYGALGVDAVLVTGADPSASHAVTALDKTGGVTVNPEAGDGHGLDVTTLHPGAVLRMSELSASGIAADDLDGGTLTLNGAEWLIGSHRMKPAPTGEGDGEVVLFLREA